MPISYRDAQPLLAAMGGPVAPASFRGALPITYRLGAGPAKAHFKISFNWDIKPLYNVVAKIPGAVFPDEWILRGNHHDGWVNGAADPSSGMAAELEEARALGELRKRGWSPRRTIVYLAWDGEEPALLGSTEWVETHLQDLQQHAVTYINSDGNDRGFLNMAGSHVLERFINDVARDVTDPETNLSVWKRKQAQIVATGSASTREQARSRADLRIPALGSGSDYTPFLQHAGIPSLNLSFNGEGDDGIYHSIYDDFYFYTHFADTDFVYGRALAQTAGTAVIRLADADVLPFRFTNLADTLQTYVKELQDLLKSRQDEIRERNRQIDDGVFAAMRDPKRPEQLPSKENVPPSLNFAPIENAVAALADAARRYQRALDASRDRVAADRGVLAAVNAKLRRTEQTLADEAGLPGRPWYRHLIYAPGLYTGYGVKTVPGVREGIEQGHYPEAEKETLRAAAAIEKLAALVASAAADLEQVR
jgi:N-acetylated-alpha-linked acidic dipeptidase